MPTSTTDPELDVRPLRKPDKHPAIFAAFDALAVGESFVLVNNHDPVHLREEFGVEHPGGFGWEYVDRGAPEWRIRITKLAATALPRVLLDTTDLPTGPGAVGAVWRLPMRERDLDSNVVALPAGTTIEAHAGPDLDVLVHVLRGSGRLDTELGSLTLAPGTLVWLPRRSRREFTAGDDGLAYLTVHQRRQALVLEVG
jgi:uncharacterized protein (DUF2249 family)/quercetin dioxygenase-like cupin family protein